jgi:hypothetical protein
MLLDALSTLDQTSYIFTLPVNTLERRPILTVPQIAKLAGYGRAQMSVLARQGRIPGERSNPGGKQPRYFDTADLRDWCELAAYLREGGHTMTRRREYKSLEGAVMRLQAFLRKHKSEVLQQIKESPRAMRAYVTCGRVMRRMLDQVEA